MKAFRKKGFFNGSVSFCLNVIFSIQHPAWHPFEY